MAGVVIDRLYMKDLFHAPNFTKKEVNSAK